MKIIPETAAQLVVNSTDAELPKEMISVTKLGDQTIVKINSSSLSEIQKCPRKAQFSLLKKFQSSLPSPALEFGSSIHAGLETFYRGKRNERIIPSGLKEKMETIGNGGSVSDEQDYLLLRATRDFVNRAASLVNIMPPDKHSIAAGIYTLFHYFTEHIDDPYHVKRTETGEPMSEIRLDGTIYETETLKIILFGTIDVILEHEHTKQTLVCDHKTTSIVGTDFYNRLKPNHQYTAYVWLVQNILNIDCEDFMVNCVQKKPLPKTSRALPPQFPRQLTKRTAEDIEDFKNTLVYYVQQFLSWQEANYFPVGPADACASYGGCTYLPVCSAPKALHEAIISARFQPN